MARAKAPSIVDPEAVYTVTLNIKGENLSPLIDGLPGDFTVEQAILVRLFESVAGKIDSKHFREWHEAFAEALTEVQPIKVKKAERLAPIPPLAPVPPVEDAKPAKKVVGTGKRKAASRKK